MRFQTTKNQATNSPSKIEGELTHSSLTIIIFTIETLLRVKKTNAR